jgi:hypothetical protein
VRVQSSAIRFSSEIITAGSGRRSWPLYGFDGLVLMLHPLAQAGDER